MGDAPRSRPPGSSARARGHRSRKVVANDHPIITDSEASTTQGICKQRKPCHGSEVPYSGAKASSDGPTDTPILRQGILNAFSCSSVRLDESTRCVPSVIRLLDPGMPTDLQRPGHVLSLGARVACRTGRLHAPVPYQSRKTCPKHVRRYSLNAEAIWSRLSVLTVGRKHGGSVQTFDTDQSPGWHPPLAID